MERAGCRLLPFGHTGAQMGGWFKEPLRSAADLRGLRIRVGGLAVPVMREAGAEPVNLPLAAEAIAQAFAEGRIVAAEFATPATDLAEGLHRSASVYHYPGWVEPDVMLGLLVNRAAWDGLPAEQRTAVEAAAVAVGAAMLAETVAQNGAALQRLTGELGVRLVPLPGDVLDALARAAVKALPEAVAGDELAREIYASVTAFRARVIVASGVGEQAVMAARAARFG